MVSLLLGEMRFDKQMERLMTRSREVVVSTMDLSERYERLIQLYKTEIVFVIKIHTLLHIKIWAGNHEVILPTAATGFQLPINLQDG